MGRGSIDARSRSDCDIVVAGYGGACQISHGRIASAGPKREVLTSDRISALFDAPIVLEEEDGYFYARPTLTTKR